MNEVMIRLEHDGRAPAQRRFAVPENGPTESEKRLRATRLAGTAGAAAAEHAWFFHGWHRRPAAPSRDSAILVSRWILELLIWSSRRTSSR